MKKSILLAMFLGAAGTSSADDSYLYWMINKDELANYSSYDNVRIKAVNGGTETYLNIYSGPSSDSFSYHAAGDNISSIGTDQVQDAIDWGEGFYASLAGLSGLSSYSFIVELWNDNNFLAQSFGDGTYGAVSAYIYSGGISAPPATPWIATSFDIPEPSSGLLMLLGMAGLALRRRKNV